MRARGVVALELIVDLSRGLQLLLQAVGPDQGGGTVHLIKVPDLLGDGEKGGVVIQLLGHQLGAEYIFQLLGGHGRSGAGVDEGGGLYLHVSPQVIPRPGHLVLGQVDLIRDFLLAHGDFSFRL